MKKSIRTLSLFLVVLFVFSCFLACGKVDETEPLPETTTIESLTETEDPRLSIKDNIPTDLKYQDEEITFFVRNDSDLYKYEIACDEIMNDTLYDAIHYRNIDVESRLGVKIKTIGQSCTWNERTSWTQTLSTAVLTNSDDFDAASFYISVGSALAKDGIYYNVMDLTRETGDGYFDFSKPWWNQTMVDELTVYGSLFFIGGSLTVSEIANGVCLFFNKDLFDQNFPDDTSAKLYDLVRTGKWTIEQMTDYVSQTWDDINSNGVIDDGDVAGIIGKTGTSFGAMDAWLFALGLDITEKDEYGEPIIAIVNAQTVPAYEALRKLFAQTPGSLLTTSGLTETKLDNGNLLFAVKMLKEGAGMRASEVNYGVLPLPKYNEEQENYRTCFANIGSAIGICSNVSDKKATMLSAVIELLSAESYKQVIPVYYSTVLQGQYSKDQVDAEMYDLILGTFNFSFGFAYSTQSLGAPGNIFRDMDLKFDIQSEIESKKLNWNQQLTNLLASLEAIS